MQDNTRKTFLHVLHHGGLTEEAHKVTQVHDAFLFDLSLTDKMGNSVAKHFEDFYSKGKSSLRRAIEEKDLEKFKLILHQVKTKEAFLHEQELQLSADKLGMNILHDLLTSNHLEMFETFTKDHELLQTLGLDLTTLANTKEKMSGVTPFLSACQRCPLPFVELFLQLQNEHRVQLDLRTKDSRKRNLLHSALMNKNLT